MDKVMNQDLLTVTHLGENPDKYMNAVVPPVFMNSLHVFDTYEKQSTVNLKEDFVYGRTANPTTTILEKKIAALEHGKKAVAFSSGMGAATAAVFSIAKTGDHIICMRNVYFPVKRLLDEYCVERLGMEVTYVAGDDIRELENAIKMNTSLIILESPATFIFKVVDVAAIAGIAKKHGIKTYIDNTFCTPIFSKPLDLGIDIVMHSISKYIGGHSDINGGVLVSKDAELMDNVQLHYREYFASILGPMEAWLAIRGLRTLPLRVKQHQETAMAVAQYLENHPKVEKVYYTGLASHPQHEIIQKQMTGHTGLMSFLLKENASKAVEFIDHLKLFGKGCSWGGFESLALCPVKNIASEDLQFMGLTEKERGLIRIHCGLEGTENLQEDLRQAFEAI
ncbi:PLP-dependent transferase [Hungatella hathewayi]|uniref:homocysteine desulfhydrase n=3 Tax=Lachnospirales TaxID=3085636 RepID=A0A3E2X2X6_9FIRM|nr:PLP-dependent transferase [Faecalicatena contorta]RGC35176.1 PLP-dependent transferase [Hungatella hathewayi]